ncbi:MAG: GTP-binding protein, partial [bacterium]|nr:GTP-binding protein [bacterium]
MAVEPELVRSFSILGATGSGKTALAEAILYRAGVLHQVSQGETRSLDTDPEEQKRGSTLVSKIQTVTWDKHRLHFADTPGLSDFIGEALAPLITFDAAVIVVDATTGVDVGTKQEFRKAEALKKPILFFINKMNKERADFEAALESIRTNLTKHAHPVALPIGAGEDFKGVMDLIDARAFVYDGQEAKEAPIPEEEKDRFASAQRHLIEEVAETSEELFDKIAEGQELKKDDILPQLITDIEEEEIIPVLVGNADPPMGSTLLLDTLTHLVLPPSKHHPPLVTDDKGQETPLKVHHFEPPVAQVFKVISDPGVGDLFFLKVLTGTLKPGMDLTNATHQSKERLGHLLVFEGKERKEVSEAVAGEIVAVAKLKQSQVGDTLCDNGRLVQAPAIEFPHPVFAKTLLPQTRKDQDKLGVALNKLQLTDPTLHYQIDPEFNETILSG